MKKIRLTLSVFLFSIMWVHAQVDSISTLNVKIENSTLSADFMSTFNYMDKTTHLNLYINVFDKLGNTLMRDSVMGSAAGFPEVPNKYTRMTFGSLAKIEITRQIPNNALSELYKIEFYISENGKKSNKLFFFKELTALEDNQIFADVVYSNVYYDMSGQILSSKILDTPIIRILYNNKGEIVMVKKQIYLSHE